LEDLKETWQPFYPHVIYRVEVKCTLRKSHAKSLVSNFRAVGKPLRYAAGKLKVIPKSEVDWVTRVTT